jgi:hypothetical protein
MQFALVSAGHDVTALAHGTMSAKESTMINQLLGDPAELLVYALALAIAAGPGQALVLTRTVEGGTRGLLTSLGLQIGTLLHTLAAALRPSTILSTSAPAYAVTPEEVDSDVQRWRLQEAYAENS